AYHVFDDDGHHHAHLCDGDRRRQKRDKRDGHDGSGNRDFKRKSKRNSKDFFNKEKKSSAKNTGFVIRHKGE
ncbi:hypothetical protein ACO0EY_08920, partial [Streptococcus pyogenes]